MGTPGGGWGAWWAPYNQHRILLTRALFWVDLKWFHGLGLVPVVADFILVGLSAFIFWIWLKDTVTGPNRKPVIHVVSLFLVAWLYSWAQYPNLIWLQTPCIIGFLVPLAAFCLMNRSILAPKRQVFFVWACVLGFASIATQANGVLALPLLVVYAVVMRQKSKRVAVLGVLTFFAWFVYTSGMPIVDRQNAGYLIAHIGQFVAYVLTYLGSPIYYLFGAGKIGGTHYLALIAGLLVVLVAAVLTVREIRSGKRDGARVGLLVFVYFTFLTALVTGFGRIGFGWQQAVAGRYATPALMCSAALLVLMAPYFERQLSCGRDKALGLLLIPLVAMLPLQVYGALAPDAAGTRFELDVSALALTLDAGDLAQVRLVYPANPKYAQSVVHVAARERLSIFGRPPLRDLAARIGGQESTAGKAKYRATIVGVECFGPSRFARITGTVFNGGADSIPRFVLLFSQDSRLVGCVYTATDRGVGGAPFKGYILSEESGRPIEFVASF